MSAPPQAVVFCGIQASGKTTFYERRFADTHVRISLDVLGTRRRERDLLEACLRARRSFVVDKTNATPEQRAVYVGAAREAGFEVVGYWFEARPRDAIARNETRPAGERIPVPGILGTYKRLRPPTAEEDFDELFRVRADGAGDFLVEALSGR